MLSDSILADFMLKLDSNILILLYGLLSTNLNEVIIKVKMIEMKQKNTLKTLQVNAKIIRNKKSNTQVTTSLKISHQATATSTVSIIVITILAK